MTQLDPRTLNIFPNFGTHLKRARDDPHRYGWLIANELASDIYFERDFDESIDEYRSGYIFGYEDFDLSGRNRRDIDFDDPIQIELKEAYNGLTYLERFIHFISSGENAPVDLNPLGLNKYRKHVKEFMKSTDRDFMNAFEGNKDGRTHYLRLQAMQRFFGNGNTNREGFLRIVRRVNSVFFPRAVRLGNM